MQKEDLIFEQYKMYAEQKEKFIDRSFMTNKFYMVVIIALLLLVFAFKGVILGRVSLSLIYSLAGMFICVLWWINMDTYNFLIKIKLAKVIEELEKSLPVMPYTMEFKSVQYYQKNKKMFLFTDLQKIFAVFCLLLFFILSMVELVPMIA